MIWSVEQTEHCNWFRWANCPSRGKLLREQRLYLVHTLQALTNEDRRPAVPREPLPQAVIDFVLAVEFNFEDNLFCKTLRSARRGAACGPSGILWPLLSSPRVVLHKLGECFAGAQVPQPIVDAIRMGHVTALRKRDGGVRGIVAGDVFHHLVARTIAKQLGEEVESATSPFQHALSTRAGCECVDHVLQGICELDPTTTITSIDGISALDLVSRRAMLSGFHRLEMGNRVLPFVCVFYPLSCWWERRRRCVAPPFRIGSARSSRSSSEAAPRW